MDDKGVPAWINLGGLVLLAVLLGSFVAVFRAALSAH